MLCSVYRLYIGGRPIDQDRLSAALPKRGNLLVEPIHNASLGNGNLRATLFEESGRLAIPPMAHVIVVRIDGRGLRINGIEVISGSREHAQFQQAWICKPL